MLIELKFVCSPKEYVKLLRKYAKSGWTLEKNVLKDLIKLCVRCPKDNDIISERNMAMCEEILLICIEIGALKGDGLEYLVNKQRSDLTDSVLFSYIEAGGLISNELAQAMLRKCSSELSGKIFARYVVKDRASQSDQPGYSTEDSLKRGKIDEKFFSRIQSNMSLYFRSSH